MLFSVFGNDAEAELVRNIRILSTRFPSSKDTPKGNNLLGSFLHDLCFWGAPHVQTKKDQQAVLTTRDISFCYSVSTSGSSGGSNNKSMKRGDSIRSRSSRDSSQASASKAIWKTAIDPVTGRTYYYDAILRKTQWNKVCSSSVGLSVVCFEFFHVPLADSHPADLGSLLCCTATRNSSNRKAETGRETPERSCFFQSNAT